ncbi:MAG: HAMP domain-containing histidine kinase [Muribaculaceae bacterium]|nr:HAMP domain-containing histidine kinase [Muribaculaceae bacterium]
MKQSAIWLLTILMALTFGGLLFIEIRYVEDIMKTREDQFTEGVKRSLYAVTGTLEMDETRYFLEEGVDAVETSSIYAQYPGQSMPNLDGIQYSFSTNTGMEGYLTIIGDNDQISRLQRDNLNIIDRSKSVKMMQENLNNQYLYQKGLIDEVILRISSKATSRPLEERVDSTNVRKYLNTELVNNGIDLPFEFGVFDKDGHKIYTSGNFPEVSEDVDNTLFIKTLFPNDSDTHKSTLRVYFPSKDKYIRQSAKFLIPAFAFTLVLLIVFVVTIIIAFRQKKLNEMKNEFINNMTHEFKTPISTISLAAQMLNDDSVRKSPGMLAHISSIINEETKRLRFQVEKVLQMSMFDRKKATVRLQDVNANKAINTIVNTFKLKVEKYGGKLVFNPEASDSIVSVDEMHFTNVIYNLLDNAVKYRREDEPLNITVTTANISSNRLQITVADNGIGIKKENLKKIFEKFYRVSTGNKHDVKGFGLGLAYVQKMIEVLGGSIKAESEINHGTKFIIILPLLKH